MSPATQVEIGRIRLKNPLIAGSAEHLIEAEGVRAALRAGAGAVVVKSTNRSQAAATSSSARSTWCSMSIGGPLRGDRRRRCTHSLPAVPGSPRSPSMRGWSKRLRSTARPRRWTRTPLRASSLTRSAPRSRWRAPLSRRASACSSSTSERLTPARRQKARSLPSSIRPRVTEIVASVRKAIAIPLWVKITGQSERVPELAHAAFQAGAGAVVMAGRLLGLIPDLDTFAPMLGTTLGVGGGWNLPLTCHWLALSRARVGPHQPLIGTNGAQCGLDIARMMLAGGSAVEMSSAVMLRGFSVLRGAVHICAVSAREEHERR